MRYARILAPLALAALLVTPLVPEAGAAPKRAAPAANSGAKKSTAYRQFTGTVVAVDASSITVEKGGKTPKQIVFARHAGMRSTGDVEKSARVTVYWRDEAGQAVAHRVVVKSATSGSQ